MKIIIGLLVLPAILSYWISCFELLMSVLQGPNHLYHVLAGVIAYMISLSFLPTRTISFIETFEHELTHTIFALLTFSHVDGFHATGRQGGYITHNKSRFDLLISLSPYFFPTFSFILLAIRLLLNAKYIHAWDFLIGASLGFHFISSWRETRPGQPDIQTSGVFNSVIFIAFGHAFCLGIIFTTLLKDGKGAVKYILSGTKVYSWLFYQFNRFI